MSKKIKDNNQDKQDLMREELVDNTVVNLEKADSLIKQGEEVDGPKEEPTRYNDWTLGGRAVDF